MIMIMLVITVQFLAIIVLIDGDLVAETCNVLFNELDVFISIWVAVFLVHGW